MASSHARLTPCESWGALHYVFKKNGQVLNVQVLSCALGDVLGPFCRRRSHTTNHRSFPEMRASSPSAPAGSGHTGRHSRSTVGAPVAPSAAVG